MASTIVLKKKLKAIISSSKRSMLQIVADLRRSDHFRAIERLKFLIQEY